MADFWYTVTLTASVKAERIFFPTPRYAAQRGVNTYSRISLRIHNQNMQKYFHPLISDLR
jgi:hypothetical protein